MYKELLLSFFKFSLAAVAIIYLKFYRIVSCISIFLYSKAVVKTYRTSTLYLIKMSVIVCIVYLKRKNRTVFIHYHMCRNVKCGKFSGICHIQAEIKHIRISASRCGLSLTYSKIHIFYSFGFITAFIGCGFLNIHIDIFLYAPAAVLIICQIYRYAVVTFRNIPSYSG